MKIRGNEYNLQELAGAFGDLGTLIPFLVGYITISKLDPVGVLVAFGLFKVVAGLYFRTPVPIQPMKAIGTAAISHPQTITPGAIWASGLFTGVAIGDQPAIAVNIGINSGMCDVGSTKLRGMGDERWTHTATGPVTNLAARFW